MISIYLDSTQKENLVYLLEENEIKQKYHFTTDYNSDSQLLAEFDFFLNQYKISLESISRLIVNLGPGSFTGTRNGITLANSLKLVRPDIKLVGLSNPTDEEIIATDSYKYSDILSPIYLNPPTITQSKKN